MLIQPLVENAVFHGICSKPQSGTIKIGAKRLGNEMIITVEDDGVGMSEDKISKLLSSDGRISGMMRTIEVSNVKKRIETIYGNGYALNISSRLGDGTAITVNIPFEQI